MTPTELRAWRTRRWLAQRDLADVLGVSSNTVNRWETGHNAIPAFLGLALERLDQISTWAPRPTVAPGRREVA
jgi:transcriptional regulator with XRE-family HTH domain